MLARRSCEGAARSCKTVIFMKKTLRCAALVAGCALAGWQPLSAQTDVLRQGMEALFRTAESNNTSIHSYRTAVEEADAALHAAEAARLPDVGAQASFSYLGDGRIWNRHYGDATHVAMPHFGNNYVLRAQQVVYAGGAIDGGIRLSELAAQMARLSADENRQRVRMLLVGLYLQLHSLHNRERVYDENIALAGTLIELTRKRRAEGVALHNDLTRYELQREQFVLGRTQAADRRRIAERELATALGADTACALLPEAAFAEVPLESEEAWQQMASGAHVALRQSALGIDMGLAREKVERAALRPKVALIAEDHLDGPITVEVPTLNKNFNYWFVGVGISYDFSSLYKGRRRVRQAAVATRHARDEHDVARQRVGDAVHAAYVNCQTAQSELRTHLKSVELAVQNYEVVANRYRNGLALVTDMTDAANVRLEAELALANARINLVYNYYCLRYAAGVL